MARSAQNLSLLLVSQQSTFGTMCTPLVSTDVIETIGMPKITNNPNPTELSLVAGGFSQDKSIVGNVDQDLTIQVPMRAGGDDSYGQCGKLLLLAGMKVAESPDGTFTFTFASKVSEMKDGTFWLYRGNLDTNEGLRNVGYNAIFSPKWTIEGGKYSTMDLTTKACFAPWAAATQPTITKEQTLPSAYVGATTMTFMGDTDYKVISLSIDPQQEVKLTKDPSATYGMGLSVITNRKINFTAKVYRDNLTTVDPMTLMLGNTGAAITIEYGTAPQKLKYNMTYAQITKIEDDDEEGVDTWTISGIAERNDFSIVMTTK